MPSSTSCWLTSGIWRRDRRRAEADERRLAGAGNRKVGLGGAQTDSTTLTLSITAVNDAPVNIVSGNQQIDAGTTLVFDVANGNEVSISDVDVGGDSPEVSLSATHGRLSLSTITGLVFIVGDGVADSNLVVSGTLVYTATASDPDTEQTLTYSLAGDAAAFTIDAQTGEVHLIDSPDFETKSSYAFSVTVTDDALIPASDTQAVVLTVRDLNEMPVFVSGNAAAVAENAPIGTVVYTASALDPDAGQSLRYEFAGPDAGAFAIDPASGAVTLRRGLDHESKPRYDLVVRAIDDASVLLPASQEVSLQVLDVNEAPQILGLPERPPVVSVGEAFVLPDFRVTDPEGDRLQLSLLPTGGRFEGVTDADRGVAGLQLAGSPDELAALLADLRFVAQTSGPATLAISVGDPFGLEATGSYPMFAVAPPDPEPPVDPEPQVDPGPPDTGQAGVASQPLLHSARPDGAPDGTPDTWVTLVAGGVDGKLAGSGDSPITGFTQADRPDSAPWLLRTPLGELLFSATGVEPGETLSFSLYLDAAVGANGFWVQGANGI
jgi:hypothetical protein